MITLRRLTLARAGQILLDGVDLTLYRGQKVGVVGANGCGKSSLFGLISGELHQESGDLDLQPRMVIARVAQETPAVETSALDYALDGDQELRRIQTQLEAAEAAHDGMQLATLHAEFDAIDGYSARSRAARLLSGLGFQEADVTRSVATFSGGWRMRLNLAQALMCRSDLLLLDEPTNHLDLDAVIWLEGWLRSYPGTLLLISHDRDFLDNTVQAIASIENRQLKLYTGNYADFERQRAASLALQQAAYDKQQREVAHLHSFIDRFRAKATKARQAQSRIKALARMELIAAAHVDSPFSFQFFEPGAMPDPLLRLDNAAVGYGDQPVLKGVSLSIEAGARIGLLGANGAGKSTLVKLLSGLLPPMEGKRVEGRGLKLGYFAQHQLEQLRPDESPLQHLTRMASQSREQELRGFLGGFNFCGDKVLSAVGPFSGGEKTRLALALLIWQRPNLLLLDEPTNHLDLEMRHALTLALQEYEGALVVVSHDRHLLRTTTDRLVLVANGRVAPFDGDLDNYQDWLAQSRVAGQANDAAGASTNSSNANERKALKREEAEQRNRLAALRRPLENQIQKLEREMAGLNAEKTRLEGVLASQDIYAEANKENLKACLLQQAEVQAKLSTAEERWLALQEELEAIEAA